MGALRDVSGPYVSARSSPVVTHMQRPSLAAWAKPNTGSMAMLSFGDTRQSSTSQLTILDAKLSQPMRSLPPPPTSQNVQVAANMDILRVHATVTPCSKTTPVCETHASDPATLPVHPKTLP